MTSEMGEMFNARREWSRQKRADNRASSLQMLRDNGWKPEIKNDGAHLRLTGQKWAADLWPGTGLYYIRVKGKPQREGRGVHNLLRIIAEFPK